MAVDFVAEQPKAKSKADIFWLEVREELLKNPGRMARVRTYNHPTLAYRARSRIVEGDHPQFKDHQSFHVVVIRDTENPFIGPRSGRVTYPHHLYITYVGPINGSKSNN